MSLPDPAEIAAEIDLGCTEMDDHDPAPCPKCDGIREAIAAAIAADRERHPPTLEPPPAAPAVTASDLAGLGADLDAALGLVVVSVPPALGAALRGARARATALERRLTGS